MGTNFPPSNKSAATYLPKDADRGDHNTDLEIRELISAVKQPEVDSSAPILTDKVRVSHCTDVLPTPFTCVLSWYNAKTASTLIVSVQLAIAVRLSCREKKFIQDSHGHDS